MAESTPAPGRPDPAGQSPGWKRAGRRRAGQPAEILTRPAPVDDQWDRYAFAARMRHRRLTTEMGWLGRVVGSPRNAPLNITGAVVVGVLVVGGVATFVLPAGERIELWKVVAPVLAAALGYAFGKKT